MTMKLGPARHTRHTQHTWAWSACSPASASSRCGCCRRAASAATASSREAAPRCAAAWAASLRWDSSAEPRGVAGVASRSDPLGCEGGTLGFWANGGRLRVVRMCQPLRLSRVFFFASRSGRRQGSTERSSEIFCRPPERPQRQLVVIGQHWHRALAVLQLSQKGAGPSAGRKTTRNNSNLVLQRHGERAARGKDRPARVWAKASASDWGGCGTSAAAALRASSMGCSCDRQTRRAIALLRTLGAGHRFFNFKILSSTKRSLLSQGFQTARNPCILAFPQKIVTYSVADPMGNS